MSLAFETDESTGQAHPVLATDFDFESLDPVPDDDARRSQQQTIIRLMQFLTDGSRTPEAAGRKLLIVAKVLGVRDETQSSLARKFKVTEAAISKRVKYYRKKFIGLQHVANTF